MQTVADAVCRWIGVLLRFSGFDIRRDYTLIVIQTAIITYTGKDLINFGKILGVTVQTKRD